MKSQDWIFEEVDNKKEGLRMIELGLINQDILKQMFSRGASKIVSPAGNKIDPKTEQLVLNGAKIGCGVCGSLDNYPLPNPLKLNINGYFNAPSAHQSSCPSCGSINEIRGHTTESKQYGQEYWVLTTLVSYPERFRGSPYLGWPILLTDSVSVEPKEISKPQDIIERKAENVKPKKKWFRF